MVKSTPVYSGFEPELWMNHTIQQIVIAKLPSTKMHCVTHLLCFYYHYKLWEHLMNNRESRMNSSMFHSVTIYYKYWNKFCLQIHTALIEACPLYLFLKIKALLLLSQRTSVIQSIVRMWISFLKSFKWSRECLPGRGKGTSGITASKLRQWDNNRYIHPSDFQNHVPHARLLRNPPSPCWSSALISWVTQGLSCWSWWAGSYCFWGLLSASKHTGLVEKALS